MDGSRRASYIFVCVGTTRAVPHHYCPILPRVHDAGLGMDSSASPRLWRSGIVLLLNLCTVLQSLHSPVSHLDIHHAPPSDSDYVFSPSATVPSGPTGGQIYPRLRHNQVLRREVLAMGHRLAAHPGVQNAILDDLVVSFFFFSLVRLDFLEPTKTT